MTLIKELTDTRLASIFPRDRWGKGYLWQTGWPSLRKWMVCSEERTVLLATENSKREAEEIVRKSGTGGMVIVGSYVKKTSQQLENLLQLKNIIGVELNVQHLLGEKRIHEIEKAVNVIDTSIRTGQDVVCYTSRDVVFPGNVGDEMSLAEVIGKLQAARENK